MSLWACTFAWAVCVSASGFVSISIGSGMDREKEQDGDERGGYRETQKKEEMMGAGGLQKIKFTILDPYCMRVCLRALPWLL